jgi:hypothetical protein
MIPPRFLFWQCIYVLCTTVRNRTRQSVGCPLPVEVFNQGNKELCLWDKSAFLHLKLVGWVRV